MVSTCVALWFMLRRSSVDQSKMIAVNNFVLAESRLRMVHARLPTHTTYATHEHSATFVYDNATHVSCTLYSVIPYRTTFEIVQDLGCAHKRCPIGLFKMKEGENPTHVPQTPMVIRTGLWENVRMLYELQDIIRIKFAIMSGSLIGLSFNGETLPWDADIDVHVIDDDIAVFDSWLFARPLMDHRPQHEGCSTQCVFYQMPRADFYMYFEPDARHHIEYRLVHVPSGVYVDITRLRTTTQRQYLRNPTQSRPQTVDTPFLAMKASVNKLWGGHIYNPPQMLPLRRCTFHGFPMWCPRDIHSVLTQQYKHYDNRVYRKKHAVFNATTRCWGRALKF